MKVSKSNTTHSPMRHAFYLMSILTLVKQKGVTFSKSFANKKSISDQPTRVVDVVDGYLKCCGHKESRRGLALIGLSVLILFTLIKFALNNLTNLSDWVGLP